MKTSNRRAAVSVLVAALLFASPGFAQVILKNGSFETPLVPVGGYTTFPTGSTLIDGWTVVGSPDQSVAIISTSYNENGGISFPAQDGNQWLDLTGAGSNTKGEGVQQKFPTILNQAYKLSFWVGNVYGGSYGTISTVEGTVTSLTSSLKIPPCKNDIVSLTTLVWKQCVFYFIADGSPTTITLLNDDGSTDNVNGLDHVVLTRVPQTGGTWTSLTHQPCSPGQPCFKAGATLLLTDGKVLVHEEPNRPGSVILPTDDFANWYILTPDVYGSYVGGTWKKVDSSAGPSRYAPLFFASAVLPDGRVIIEGGEYLQPGSGQQPIRVWTNQGAIFNPTSPTGSQWTSIAPPPGWSTIGDAQSVVLPDGTFMLADCCSPKQAEMIAPYSGGSSWISTGKLKHDFNDEEAWTLLPGPPDAEVLLTVDTSVLGNSTCTLPDFTTASEIYVDGYWFCVGNTPTQLWGATDNEIGPAVLRPDGTVFQTGANGAPPATFGTSAIFDSSTFQWTAGPNFTCLGCPTYLDIADGPAALLPNGNVLMMTSPHLPKTLGAVFFELQYGTDQLVKAAAPPNAPIDASFFGHMLVLPTGQIMFTDFSSDVEIYTPTDRKVDRTWAPSNLVVNNHVCTSPFCVTSISVTGNTVSGLQLNGMSQGAAYGDDYQSATNYPLVRLSSLIAACPLCQPVVYYCRTYNHSSMGVATRNLPVSTNFDCVGVPRGEYNLEVVANGISVFTVLVAK